MKKGRRRFPKVPRALLAALAVLLAIRIVLPYGIEWSVNRILNENPEYEGRIVDVDLRLWRGAYSIEGIRILKHGFDPESADQALLNVERVDLALSWADLLKGQIVARAHVEGPRVNFIDLKDRESPEGISLDKTLKRLMPFKLSRFTVSDGEVRFRNPKTSPPVELAISRLHLELENLTNARKAEDRLFATLKAGAITTGDGKAEVSAVLNPTASELTFDLNARLTGLELKSLNSFLKAYGNFDFEAGEGDIVAEIAAADGKIRGYVKPLFTGVKVLSVSKEVERDKDSIFRIAWEGVVGGATRLFRNWPEDQLGTRIPIQGEIEDPDVNPWTIVANTLRNAFVTAFTPYYDRTISLRTTQGGR